MCSQRSAYLACCEPYELRSRKKAAKGTVPKAMFLGLVMRFG